MNRWSVILVLFGLGAITCVVVLWRRSSGDGASGSPLPHVEQRTCRIGIQDNTVAALVRIAESERRFAEHGVRVQVVPYPSGKLAVKGMLAGDVDMATSSDMVVMCQAFQGTGPVVVATIAGTGNGAWIVARRDLGILSPADLVGKRIATQQHSAVHFFLSMFLLHHMISESSVELVFMPAVELPSALIAGTIHAFSMRNPFIRQARDELGDKAIEFRQEEVYRQSFCLVTNRDFLRDDRDTVTRVLRALSDADRLCKESVDGAKAAAIKGFGEDRREEILNDWDHYLFRLQLDQSLVLTLEDQARWAIKNGLFTGPDVPNFLDSIDFLSLEAVAPGAVNIAH